MFIRYHTTHERDRQAHTQTDRQTPHDGIGRPLLCIASRGKKSTLRDSRLLLNTFKRKLLTTVAFWIFYVTTSSSAVVAFFCDFDAVYKCRDLYGECLLSVMYLQCVDYTKRFQIVKYIIGTNHNNNKYEFTKHHSVSMTHFEPSVSVITTKLYQKHQSRLVRPTAWCCHLAPRVAYSLYQIQMQQPAHQRPVYQFRII